MRFAKNYSGGMHTGDYINKQVAFDNRRFGVAASRSQEDIHAAMELTTPDYPPLSSFRGHQQKRKKVNIASRRTASMWMFQTDAVINAKVAVAVVECMPFSDEGNREGVGCCVVGMRCNLPGREGSWVDFLGIEEIENKEGRSIGAGMLRITRRREVQYIWYFWLSDSYGGIVGHRTGAIAYLRVELERPLVFPIKCAMHIVSRCWKTVVCDLDDGGVARRLSNSGAGETESKGRAGQPGGAAGRRHKLLVRKGQRAASVHAIAAAWVQLDSVGLYRHSL